jgi:hypothetical protein
LANGHKSCRDICLRFCRHLRCLVPVVEREC